MFGKFKAHKKKIALALAVLGVAAGYLVGDLPADAAIKALLVAVGL